MRALPIVTAPVLVVGLAGCDVFGPRWGPDVVAGTWVEQRDDDGVAARLVLESGATPPDPNALYGYNGANDGEVVLGVFSTGDPRADAEAAALPGIDVAAVLVDMDMRGAVAAFDAAADRGRPCGEDTVIGLGDATLHFPDVDSDADDFEEFYQPKLRLVIEADDDTAVGTLTFRTSLHSDIDEEITVPLTLVREEGAVTKPGPCREKTNDGSSASSFLGSRDLDSGGGGDLD